MSTFEVRATGATGSEFQLVKTSSGEVIQTYTDRATAERNADECEQLAEAFRQENDRSFGSDDDRTAAEREADDAEQEYVRAHQKQRDLEEALAEANAPRMFAEMSPAEQAEYREAQQADIEHARQTGEVPWGLGEFVHGSVTYGPDMIADGEGVRAKTPRELAAEQEYRAPVYAALAADRQAAEDQRRAALSPQERADEDAARARLRAQVDAMLRGDDDADDDADGA